MSDEKRWYCYNVILIGWSQIKHEIMHVPKYNTWNFHCEKCLPLLNSLSFGLRDISTVLVYNIGLFFPGHDFSLMPNKTEKKEKRKPKFPVSQYVYNVGAWFDSFAVY